MRNTVRKRGFIKSLLPSFGPSDAPLFHRSVRGIDPTLLILVLLLAVAAQFLVIALAVAVTALVVNDTLWRKYCNALEERYTEVQNGVHEQSDP